MNKTRLIILLFMLIHTCVSAQGNYSLRIIPADKDTGFLEKEFSYHRNFTDTVTRSTALKELLGKLYQKGYLEASYDSFHRDSANLTAFLFVGHQWEWANLSNGNVDDVLLDRIGFRERVYDGKPFSISQLNKLTNEILTYCEDNGYPFAAVRLDSIKAENQQISAKIFLTKNKVITIDSIIVKGDARISNRYLGNYLGLRLPSIYREDVIKKISTRLKELPFLSEEKPAQLLFSGDKASIILYLKKKNASNFDFVLGVLPNSASTGKLLITGDGRLNLNNPFGKGESLNFKFSQLQSRTTQVLLKGAYPYLFNLPFGIDGEFDLYKNDTLYLEVKEQLGFQFLFTGVNYLKIFFRNTSNSVLSLDTATVIQSKQLPAYLNLEAKFYGFECRFEKLDYRINPQKGSAVFFNAEAGNRNVKEDARIVELKDPSDPSFDFSALYDSVETKETQFRFNGNLDKYWAVSRRSSFKTSYNGAAIASRSIFQNELYHIGGFHLLRGFDEQSIFVSQYHIVTVEYHYLLSQNSFAYLFFDGAYVENKAVVPATHDTPMGFGAGFNFETKAGIFGVSYALGRQQDNPIEFRSAKIHFGYVNYF